MTNRREVSKREPFILQFGVGLTAVQDPPQRDDALRERKTLAATRITEIGRETTDDE